MLKQLLPAVIIVGMIAAGVFWLRPPDGSRGGSLPTATVKRGPLRVTLRQLGELRAVRSTNIFAPISGKISDLVPEGTFVREGEVVASLDTEEQTENLEANKVALDIASTRLERAREEQTLDARLNELSLQEARKQLEYELSKLEDAEATLAKTQRLVEARIAPRQNLEDAELRKLSQELQVQNARIAVNRAEKLLLSQRDLKKADVSNASIELEKAATDFNQTLVEVRNAAIRAPTSGLVIYKQIWKGGNWGKVQPGDQVWERQHIMEIPELGAMEVLTMIDEIDISLLDLNQSVAISLEAFPDRELTGYVASIGKLAQDPESSGRWRRKSSGRKVFEVVIRIHQKDESLRPGVTAPLEILIEDHDRVLYIPLEALFVEEGEEYVYVMDNGAPTRKAVKTGSANFHSVVIEEGLQEGQEVCLIKPSDVS